MSSNRKGVTPLISVALLMILVIIASSLLASNISMNSFQVPGDNEKNKLLESIAIVDVMEDVGDDTTVVTVYIQNKGTISANVSAIYMGDVMGKLIQANLDLNRIVSYGEIIGIQFTKSNSVNWTTYLAVTTRGNVATYLYGSENTKVPDYVYTPGFMIGYNATPVTLEDPPYNTTLVFDDEGNPLTPRDIEANSSIGAGIKQIQASGNHVKIQLDNKASSGSARFRLYSADTSSINISLVRQTSASGGFKYLEVSFYDYSTHEYVLVENITDAEWPHFAVHEIFVSNAESYYDENNLCDMNFTIHFVDSAVNFMFDIIMDQGDRIYDFNPRYVVSLSNPDPSLYYIRGVLFELAGLSSIPGNYSLWLCGPSSDIPDLRLDVSNSSGTYSVMYLGLEYGTYTAFYQGNILDYLDSDYNLVYMIVADFDIDQNLSVSFSSMQVELFVQIEQQ